MKKNYRLREIDTCTKFGFKKVAAKYKHTHCIYADDNNIFIGNENNRKSHFKPCDGKLISCLGCSSNNPLGSILAVKRIYYKEDERQFEESIVFHWSDGTSSKVPRPDIDFLDESDDSREDIIDLPYIEE